MTTDTSAPLSAHVSAAEAARMYGLSEKTVRRWIKAGKLHAEMVQGAYSVALKDVSALTGGQSAHPTPLMSTQGTDTSADIGADTPDEDVLPPEPSSMALIQAEAMAQYTRSLLEPMVQLVAEQQTTIREQAETIGALRTENDALKAAQVQQEARTAVEPAPAPVESPTPLWRGRWSLVLAIVAVVLLLFVLVLAWSR